jgi:hypothetical protein
MIDDGDIDKIRAENNNAANRMGISKEQFDKLVRFAKENESAAQPLIFQINKCLAIDRRMGLVMIEALLVSTLASSSLTADEIMQLLESLKKGIAHIDKKQNTDWSK